MTDKLLKYLTDSDYRFLINSSLGLHKKIPDELYLKRVYRARLKKQLDLETPKTFNEKLQWLKLHDRKPEYTVMADKAGVKDYAAKIIGEEYMIPTLGIYGSFDEIDFDVLPNRFVLKCTHDSGGVVICHDKTCFDIKQAKKTLNRNLKRDYFYQWREWPYKNIKKQIIAEEYLDAGQNGLTDYKIHCFNGKARLILVCQNRFAKDGLTEDFFDTEWRHLDIKRPDTENSQTAVEKPAQLEKMLALAETLAKDIPFARIDFYIHHQKIKFSEITLFPAAGFTAFVPDEWDSVLGKWLQINRKKRD